MWRRHEAQPALDDPPPDLHRRTAGGTCPVVRVPCHAAELHRPLRHRHPRAGDADRCRRPHFLRAGGLCRPGRLYLRLPDDGARGFALADAACRPVGDGDRRPVAGARDPATVRPLPSPGHHRLGHQPLLPVRQPGGARRSHRHFRRAATAHPRRRTPLRSRLLLPDLGHPARADPGYAQPARLTRRAGPYAPSRVAR
jgi:hypothetical protein